jgi:hypothetical protein
MQTLLLITQQLCPYISHLDVITKQKCLKYVNVKDQSLSENQCIGFLDMALRRLTGRIRHYVA